MALYNLTQIANSTSYLEFVQGVNSGLMDNTFGILILTVVSIIAFISFLSYNPDPRPAFIGASFIAFIMAIGFKVIGLVPDLAIIITIVMLALSIAFGSNR